MKKTTSILLGFIFLFFCSVSCDKEPVHIVLNGYLLEPYSGNPVPDADIVIKAKKLSSGVWNANLEVIASGKTDANGRYEIDFEKFRFEKLVLEFSRDDYYNFNAEIPGEDLEGHDNFMKSFDMLAEAYVDINIVNEPPFSITDYMEFQFVSGYVAGLECCRGDLEDFRGDAIDQHIVCKVIGNRNIEFQWFVIEGDQKIKHTGQVFCPAFETTEYELSY